MLCSGLAMKNQEARMIHLFRRKMSQGFHLPALGKIKLSGGISENLRGPWSFCDISILYFNSKTLLKKQNKTKHIWYVGIERFPEVSATSSRYCQKSQSSCRDEPLYLQNKCSKKKVYFPLLKIWHIQRPQGKLLRLGRLAMESHLRTLRVPRIDRP